MTIDTTATEPPRNWFLEIAKAPTEDLLREATGLRAKLAIARQKAHISDARAYELRLADVERALAIHNRRATEAEDQRVASSLVQRLRDALTEACKQVAHHNAEYKHVTPDARLDAWRALIAEPEGDPAQREADLREAFLDGMAWAYGRSRISIDQSRDQAAAEYARSKAGG